MSPSFSMHYIMNSYGIKTKLLANLFQCQSAILVQATNFLNIRFCKFSAIMRASISSGLAAFLNEIPRIICGSSKKQVAWVYAVTIITRMANIKTFRNWSFMKLIRKAMTKSWLAVDGYLTVSASARHRPQPASIWHYFISARKSFFNCKVFSGSHIPNIINKHVYIQ